MSYVLTVDQVGSRHHQDLVGPMVKRLTSLGVVLPFTRTVGDEFQGLLTEPVSVVDAILILMRGEKWHIGLGIGAVDTPLPTDPRSARGAAFLAARTAVEGAKQLPSHLRVIVEGSDQADAEDVEAVFGLVAALYRRRTDAGWQAVDAIELGGTQNQAAKRLGISRQAVSQRLLAAEWSSEIAARPCLIRLVERAARSESPAQ